MGTQSRPLGRRSGRSSRLSSVAVHRPSIADAAGPLPRGAMLDDAGAKHVRPIWSKVSDSPLNRLCRGRSARRSWRKTKKRKTARPVAVGRIVRNYGSDLRLLRSDRSPADPCWRRLTKKILGADACRENIERSGQRNAFQLWRATGARRGREPKPDWCSPGDLHSVNIGGSRSCEPQRCFGLPPEKWSSLK